MTRPVVRQTARLGFTLPAPSIAPRIGGQVPNVRANRPANAGRLELVLPLARNQHLADGMDDAVRRSYVRLHHPRATDEDLASDDAN
jgi:hypothetical protein